MNRLKAFFMIFLSVSFIFGFVFSTIRSWDYITMISRIQKQAMLNSWEILVGMFICFILIVGLGVLWE